MSQVSNSKHGTAFVEGALTEKDVLESENLQPYFIEPGDPNDTNQPPAHFTTANTIQLFGVREGETLEEALHRQPGRPTSR
jgi:hypothetical protein